MLKGLISTIWLFSVPKSPIELVSVYPATLLAGAHYAFSRDQLSLTLMGLAFLWDFTVGFWLMVNALTSPSRSLLRTLIDLKDCTYFPLELDQVLDDPQRVLLERKSLFEYLKRAGLPWNHTRDISVFRVEMGPSCTIISGLAAYNIPFLGAVLLIRDEPDQADVPERFAFWHEVGHTLGDEFARQAMLEKGVTGVFVSVVLSLLLIKLTLLSGAIVAMTAFSSLLLGRTYSHLRKSHRLNSECRADWFALQFMKQTDIEYLRRNVLVIVPDDGELSESQLIVRRIRFEGVLDDLGLASSHVDPEMYEFLIDATLTSLNLLGWMALLAGQFRPLESRDASFFLWAVSALAAVAIGRYILSYLLRICADLILLGSRCWRDGKFEFGGN